MTQAPTIPLYRQPQKNMPPCFKRLTELEVLSSQGPCEEDTLLMNCPVASGTQEDVHLRKKGLPGSENDLMLQVSSYPRAHRLRAGRCESHTRLSKVVGFLWA